MVVVEEEHHQEAKRQCGKDPFGVEFPEMDEPAAWLGRVEGAGDRDEGDVGGFEITGYMREAYPEDGSDLVHVSDWDVRCIVDTYHICVVGQ